MNATDNQKLTTMLNSQQVTDQMKRFEAAMKVANLVKIGNLVIEYINEGDARQHLFISRVLRLYNVCGSYYHPNQMHFYSDILLRESIVALSDHHKNRILAPLTK